MLRPARRRPPVLLALALAAGLLAALPAARAAKLLLVPLSSDTHIAAMTALSTALEAHGGHEITMVVSDALLGTAQSLAASRAPGHRHRYVTFPFNFAALAPDLARIAKSHPIVAMAYGYRVLAGMIDNVLSSEPLMQELAALRADLIIGDASAGFGSWLSNMLGVPAIEFDPGTSSALLHSMYGGQTHPAYLPAPGTFFPSTGLTFAQRVANTVVHAAVRGMVLLHAETPWGPFAALAARHRIAHLPGHGPSRPLLLLVNFDWALEPPRPIGPSIKYLGALMPRPAEPLSPELAAWFDAGGAEAPFFSFSPVVYLSFGASFSAPEAAVPAVAGALAAAAARHPMRFLVSMRPPEQELLRAALQALGAQLPPEQLLLVQHTPQNDVLGDPRVAAFVTQGGYLSLQEAAYHAVPVICIPLSLGQEEIAQHAADHGRGLVVPKEALLAGDATRLAAALTRLVGGDTSGPFKQQALLTAARLRAHPRSPGQQAADWVAYALALPRGSFLHTQGQDMPWWQLAMLDVAAAGVAAAAALWFVLRRALRAVGARLGPRRAGDAAAGGATGGAAAGKAKHS